MWSETLHTDMNTDANVTTNGITRQWYGEGTFDPISLADGLADQFRWSGTADSEDATHNHNILVAPYISNKGKINDCNEVPTKYLHLFPACNVCAGLNYGGFAEGWRLPSQRLASHDIETNCSGSYAYGSVNHCAANRQLWDLGMENCSHWDPNDCTAKKDPCKPRYDRKAASGYYWSSTQSSGTHAWHVGFNNAAVYYDTKSKYYLRVRCFLGQWP